jgi:hypothetical protein
MPEDAPVTRAVFCGVGDIAVIRFAEHQACKRRF